MRYAKKAITFAMGIAIIGGSISAAAAEDFRGTYNHFDCVRHDSYRSGDRDRDDWRIFVEPRRGEHRNDDRDGGHGSMALKACGS